MQTVVPSSSALKPDLLKRIESMSEEELQLMNQVLLHAEKEKLWREISTEAEDERISGKYDRLPEIISKVRSEQRSA